MRPRTYSLALGGGAALLFLTVAAANLLTDPQGVFGTAVFPIITENHRYSRFLEYQRSADTYDGLIFGSSRAGGISRDDLSQKMGYVNFANFSVDVALMTDHLPVLEYVIKQKMARGLPLKAVFLLLDLDHFGNRPYTNETLHFLLPPAVSGESYARFWWRNLTGIQYEGWSLAISKAWSTRPGIHPSAMIKALVRAVAAAGSTQAAAAELAETQERRGSGPPATVKIADRVDFKHQLRLLERFVSLCREHNVSLIVATPPLSRTRAMDFDADDLRQAADLISRVVPLWDFADPKGLPEDPVFWRDYNHFYWPLGRLMLDRIFGTEMPADWRDFGRLRTPQLPGT
jgi:hypothetical protein